MHWTDRRERYRTHIAGGACIHPGSVYDAISARIAEEIGFEIGMFAGSIGSFTVLGAPDLIVLTLTEFAAQAYRINRAGKLPLMVDADHGYGNALNVMRTVQELETAGVAALMIEDTALPRPFGSDGRALISIAEGRGKMAAAVAARRDAQLIVLARTTIGLSDDFGDTLARVEAYQTTGVDGIFLAGLATRAQLDAIAQVTRLPLVTGGVRPELADPAYLRSRGVTICLQGHQPIQAAYQAVYNCLKALKQGVKPAELEGLPSSSRFSAWLRDEHYAGLIKRHLGGE